MSDGSNGKDGEWSGYVGVLYLRFLLFSVFWKDRFVNIIFVGFFLESCYAHMGKWMIMCKLHMIQKIG